MVSSTTSYGLVLGFLAAAIAGGTYLLLRSEANEQSRGGEPTQEVAAHQEAGVKAMAGEAAAADELSTLRYELASLRAELAAFKRQVRSKLDAFEATAAHNDETPESVDAKATGFNAEPSGEKLRAQEDAAAARDRAESRQRLRAFEAALRAERADGAWSRAAVGSIQAALSEEALSATVAQNTTCRATLCRLVVVHANPDERAEFERTFPVQIGEVLPRASFHTEEREDGSSVSTVFLAREGYRFPGVTATDAR